MEWKYHFSVATNNIQNKNIKFHIQFCFWELNINFHNQITYFGLKYHFLVPNNDFETSNIKFHIQIKKFKIEILIS